MLEPAPEIRRHYESEIVEADRLSRGAGRLELVRTQEIIRRHLPGPPLEILDVGGGAGVHAAWLADDGHSVHVIDPMPSHVEQANRLAGPRRRITAEVGDARRLAVTDGTVDAVLLLGPLYHLTERDDRVLALSEAGRVVRPGGFVFVAAISRFASLLDGLSREFLTDPGFRSIVEGDLRDGQHRNPDRVPHWFTTAYFHHPAELPDEASEAGWTASRSSALKASPDGSTTSSTSGTTPTAARKAPAGCRTSSRRSVGTGRQVGAEQLARWVRPGPELEQHRREPERGDRARHDGTLVCELDQRGAHEDTQTLVRGPNRHPALLLLRHRSLQQGSNVEVWMGDPRRANTTERGR